MKLTDYRGFFLSLKGHVVIIGTPLFVMLSITSLWVNYSAGTLTPMWAIRVLIVTAVFAPIMATMIWYLVTRPFIGTKKP